jgi:hypothetical protein
MCIDYTSLNKACPKDPFPLPLIDQIMDSTSDCDLLCFINAYSGFHQIPMSREDEEHTAFIIVDGLFCYVSMPYGLKNALPTFMCAMHQTFGDLIRDLVEVYVDDIIIKIKSLISAGQSREDQGNQRDAAASLHQGCPEAHGMLGRAQSVYL